MKIDMKTAGNSSVLAGATAGKAMLRRLLEMVAAEPDRPLPLFLDFSAVEVATASYLRESVVALRGVVRARDSHYYPVIANLNESVRDELVELTRAGADVFITCVLADDGTVSRPALLGELESKQLMTFKLVQQRRETDASELMRTHGRSEKVRHTTAWNNRLSSLASLGLVVEERQGRLKRYRPVLQEG